MDLHRYHRQMLLPDIGERGQRRLAEASVLVVGCGALGAAVSDGLARAGVGRLVIVDRDVVEITNLQRQVLYDEDDVRVAAPKAEAARARLAAVNGAIEVEAHVADFNHRSARRLAEDVDVLVDGLDNFETRYLLNDLAVALHLPYVYAGAVGYTAMSMTVLPHPASAQRQGGSVRWPAERATPCLRCLFPQAPPPGTTPTCDTAGVLGPAVLSIAAHQATQTIKLLVGNLEALDRSLLTLDVWANEHRRIDMSGGRRDDCPCCAQGRLDHLEGRAASAATSLCGRNAVQVLAAGSDGAAAVDLERLCHTLATHGRFTYNGHLLRGTFDGERGSGDAPVELTLFPDGRAIIAGVNEPEAARAIYARYIGA